MSETPEVPTEGAPHFYSPASAAQRLGVDARTVRSHARPSAWLLTTTGSEWPLYSEADLAQVAVDRFAQARGRARRA